MIVLTKDAYFDSIILKSKLVKKKKDRKLTFWLNGKWTIFWLAIKQNGISLYITVRHNVVSWGSNQRPFCDLLAVV